jgi:anti-sigma factor RsiW
MEYGLTGKETPMLCHDVRPFIARRADDPASLLDLVDARTIAAVDAHLESCASCREALDTQRNVSAWLRTRPADRLSPHFASQLAARLDEASGWFGIADWRAWTLRLAPVAAALALATYLGLGASTQSPATIDEWTLATTDSSAESILWESDMSADSLMETMLTGELPVGSGETGNVR